MLPEYHLYLITLLMAAGFPVYLAVWVRRFLRFGRGLGPRPSRLVLGVYFIGAVAFLFFIATGGPFRARARQFEARQNLARIFLHQREYKAAHGEYMRGKGTLAAFKFQPLWKPDNYAIFCGDDTIEPPVPSPFRPDGIWPLRDRPAGSATGYTCMAVGNIDWDGWPDVWLLNDARVEVNRPTDLWSPAPDDFTGPARLYPDHPRLARLDPDAFWFDSLAVTVGLPAVLLALLGWEEWKRRKKVKS